MFYVFCKSESIFPIREKCENNSIFLEIFLLTNTKQRILTEKPSIADVEEHLILYIFCTG